LIEAGDGEAGFFFEGGASLENDGSEREEDIGIVLEFVVAEEAAVERFVFDLVVLGGVGDDLEPLGGGGPFLGFVVVRGEEKGGGFDVFTGGPVGCHCFETSSAGVWFTDFAIAECEEIPTFESVGVLAVSADELVKGSGGTAVGSFALFGILFSLCVVVVQRSVVEEVACGIDDERGCFFHFGKSGRRLLSHHGMSHPEEGEKEGSGVHGEVMGR
jgi:hypothetical protein